MTTSVALCTYNGARYLEEQLQSISTQTLLPDELVVCDDASIDDTLKILESFSKNAPFKVSIYRNESNLGSNKNFEKALSLCIGEIVFLCDQDDIWLPGKVETLVAFFNENANKELVFSDGYIFDSECRTVASLWEAAGFSPEERSMWREGRGFELLIKNNNVATGATMAIRRVFLEKVLPLPNTRFWIHDGILVLTAAALHKVVFTEKKLIRYRQHSSQQVGFGTGKKFSALEAIVKKIKKREWLPSDEVLPILLNDLIHIRSVLENLKIEKKQLRILDNKICHLQKRMTAAKKGFFEKTTVILSEILNNNYRNFSSTRSLSAWFYILKDLVGMKKIK